MLPKSNQLAEYYESEMLRRSHQTPERGYAGMGYWYSGYPTYIGALTTAYGGLTGTTTETPVQAQPTEGSPIAEAATEAGATTSGVASGESGTAAS
jgi:hypothetical protein